MTSTQPASRPVPCVLAFLLAAVGAGCGSQGKYHDKTASEWLAVLKNTTDAETRIEALEGIGIHRLDLSEEEQEALVAQLVTLAIADRASAAGKSAYWESSVVEDAVALLVRLARDGGGHDSIDALEEAFDAETTTFKARSRIWDALSTMGSDADVIVPFLCETMIIGSADKVDLVGLAGALGNIRTRPDDAVWALRHRLALILPRLPPAPPPADDEAAAAPIEAPPLDLDEALLLFDQLALRDIAEAIIDALVKYGADAHAAVFLLLEACSTDLRPRAKEALVECGLSALPALLTLLHNTELPPEERAEAAQLIASIRDSESESMRPELPFVISHLGDAAAADPSPFVRREIARLLWTKEVPRDSVSDGLMQLLTDDAAEVREEVRIGLAHLARSDQEWGEPSQKVMPKLQAALEDENDAVRKAAQEVLDHIHAAGE